MKKAVMYGAGNIGRGFIGKVLADSGYEVCFLDIVPEVIQAFNADHKYDVKVVSTDGEHTDTVHNVCALHADSPEAIDAIADCDLMATAVGVNVLKFIAPNIAQGVKKRIQKGKGPLDIILAENQMDADKIMRGYIYESLDDNEKKWADDNLGLVEASIGRMVPSLAAYEGEGNPLLITVEEYALLPVDKDAFKGEVPKLVGLVPHSPFSFYTKRKLFIHNMGHALCAYFGWKAGCEYISEAVENGQIHDRARQSMMLSAQALNEEYGVPMQELEDHVDDLLYRFKNKALRDTVARVGADPIRKLRKNDRLVGAALYVLDSGHAPDYIVKGIVAALGFDNQDDKSAMQLQKDLISNGVEYVIKHYMELDLNGLLAQMILKEYEREENG